MIEIPKEDYIHREENGHTVTYSTLRQQLKHFIGLDWKDPYKRHGRLFYKPYRNGYSTNRDNKTFDELVKAGYMRKYDNREQGYNSDGATYHLTREGLDWLGEALGITIRDPE